MPSETTSPQFWDFVQTARAKLSALLEQAVECRDRAAEIAASEKQRQKAFDESVKPTPLRGGWEHFRLKVSGVGESPDEAERRKKEAAALYRQLDSKITDHYRRCRQVEDGYTRLLGELQQPSKEHGQARKILSQAEAERLALRTPAARPLILPAYDYPTDNPTNLWASSGVLQVLPVSNDVVIRKVEELKSIVEDFENSRRREFRMAGQTAEPGAQAMGVAAVKPESSDTESVLLLGSQSRAAVRAPNRQNPKARSSDVHLAALEQILERTTLEKWAKEKRLSRSTLFRWKALRKLGESFQGQISVKKNAEIEKTIEEDAKKLGIPIRTCSD